MSAICLFAAKSAKTAVPIPIDLNVLGGLYTKSKRVYIYINGKKLLVKIFRSFGIIFFYNIRKSVKKLKS